MFRALLSCTGDAEYLFLPTAEHNLSKTEFDLVPVLVVAGQVFLTVGELKKRPYFDETPLHILKHVEQPNAERLWKMSPEAEATEDSVDANLKDAPATDRLADRIQAAKDLGLITDDNPTAFSDLVRLRITQGEDPQVLYESKLLSLHSYGKPLILISLVVMFKTPAPIAQKETGKLCS